MQRNRPGLTNIETSNNLIGNTIPLSAGYPPHTTSSYNGGLGAPTLSLQSNSSNFYNQSQKLHIESESVRSSYNPLRISKGGVNFIQSMTPEASSTTQGVFGQNINQGQGNNFGAQHYQHQHRYQQAAMQNQNQPHSNHQQNGNTNSSSSYEQQFTRQFGNASSSLNKDQNKSESYSNTQQILLNTSSGNSNARNNSQKQQPKVTGKQSDSLQNTLNFSRNFQQNTSTVNSNNNSNHFQNINGSQANTLNSNINKLSIDTSGEARPYSANNFTSYSATNSSAPMFGTKHSLISSLNGLMTTKFNEKGSLEFQSTHNQMQQQQQQQPSSQTQIGNIPTLNTSYQRHNLANQHFAAQNSENNQQGNYNSNHLQRNSNNNGNNQQQNIRDESPSIKAKQNNYMQSNNMNGQQQQVSQSQGNNSFMNGQNSNNGFKKQVGASINLKEGFASYKQQEEQKRLSKSIQGHEIQRVIQSQQTQQYTQQQPGQQPYQQQNQQKNGQNNENINPLAQQQQQQQIQNNQMKKQVPLSNSSQVSVNQNQTQNQQQNQAAMDQKQMLKAQLTQNVNEPLIGKSEPLPNHEPTKCSFKRNGIVKAYAANTNQGLVRNYNEDRVSIILNIMKPASRANEQWPKCSFFGVYDGHGGVNCADFLRDNLHQFVIKESSFPWNPKEALRNGFAAAEKAFLDLAQAQEDQIDRSGSCAIVILIVGDTCYVANVGDSRAVLSGESGQKVYTLSRDHKPTDELEQKRIIQGGGKIYQTHATQVKQGTGDQKAQTQLVVGPLRVFPGRLSVSRTFGDIEAKVEKLGGNPNVVISEPEIKSFKITDDHDFIVLASDGVFDKMTSKEVIQSVWNNEEISENVHKQCSVAVESILRDSLNKRSLDNVTVVMIAFNNYKIKLFGNQEKKNKPILEERKNFQQPALNSADYASHGNKLEYSSVLNQGNKTATASSSQHYNGDFNKFSDKDFRKSLNITPSNRAAAGELQLRKKFKENQIYGNNENYSYMNSSANNGNNNFNNNQNNQPQSSNTSQISNTNSGNQIHAQFNKLRLLDQKISEISNKVNQFSSFDRKISSNNR
ncbi:hypothetical protein ABPG74_010650 [Tetrahymena malaccensis]